MSISANDVIVRLPLFKEWLSSRGAEILEPTNEYEIIRFRTVKGVSIIYKKKSAAQPCTFFNEAETAWDQFNDLTKNWRAAPRAKRELGKSREDCKTLRKRDGDYCFFCCLFVTSAKESVEHLVPLTHGGPDHISNKFLAHRECNLSVGCMSAIEKINIHTRAKIKLLREADERALKYTKIQEQKESAECKN